MHEGSIKALQTVELRKVYGSKVEALKGISFAIEQGDFFALLGPNGAGKSTTIGIIASLVNKSSGQVKVFGYDLDTETEAVKRQIGLVPQEFNFNMFEKVSDILVQQAGYYGIPLALAEARTEKYLKQLELWEKRATMARNLSGGMKRRLMIARALVHEPKLLILDEPTAGVDIEIRRSLWNFMRQINAQGTTIILTTHYLEEVEELCRNVAIIDRGEILVHTTIKALLARLDSQTFVVDLLAPCEEIKDHNQMKFRKIDSTTFEVDVPRALTLNVMFSYLDSQRVAAVSMRAKSNRIESMFLDLIKQGSSDAQKRAAHSV